MFLLELQGYYSDKNFFNAPCTKYLIRSDMSSKKFTQAFRFQKKSIFHMLSKRNIFKIPPSVKCFASSHRMLCQGLGFQFPQVFERVPCQQKFKWKENTPQADGQFLLPSQKLNDHFNTDNFPLLLRKSTEEDFCSEIKQ